MTESSLLEMTAEVSVAFAGFIGIFLVLSARDGRFPGSDALVIRSIVINSVGPVFYAALPLILHTMGVSGAILWRISSVVVGLTAAVGAAFIVRQVQTVPVPDREPFLGFESLTSLAFGALMFLPHLGNALAWPWAPSGGPYILAVWSVVAIAAISFVGLIFRKVL